MATVYVDTSALGRVLLRERDAPAIMRELERFGQRISSRLLRVELRRLGLREGLLPLADGLLATIALFPLGEALLVAAGSLPPSSIKTLDAIHLATALRISTETGLDALMTYDLRLTAAAREHGLTVLSPA